ncbi:hypothetical protein D1632_12380 [Chryseobacterium nematophagum]|uniref:TonB-dependent receptor plug domain-containing protein n=1 Tax=Chryseobacterium nematophagum TaxID=2305228 RepID=A0A3M7LA45_9FLAO|nr:hypothetical protein [Chryseobacterium nematophagum]RMZ58412.1 hypothetical protein D1632_12380 [Chryseobacterium nematophagum]
MPKKLLLFVALSTSPYFIAQDKAESALKTFAEKFPQEKIHIVLDKKNYLAGDNLWFKSFVFDGYSPSQISTSLFVELYDNNKKQIDKKLIPLLNGEGSGSFTLSENLKEDVYYVRAYTAWMTNFNEDFQSIQPIEIYNPSSPEKLTKDTISSWSASLYPESGTFIEGINTKFAVRIKSKGSYPTNWGGYIIDTEKPNNKLVTFKGLDENTGLFKFTSQSGKKYQLIVEDDKGKKQNIDLPSSSSSGIHLEVVSKAEAITFTLKSKNIQEAQSYKILGTINNQLVYKARISSSDQNYSIPTEKLVNGILQLTVFDEKENVIAQRLCFVQPELLKINKPSLQSLSFNESSRSSNSFTIKGTEESSYTVLVLDGKSESSEDENSLLSSIWLTGDIHSEIYSPAQYFKKGSNPEALDALLLSEKWTRFDWKLLLSGNYPTIKYKPEPYISYKGKVSIQGKPAVNTDLNLVFEMPNHGTKFYQVKTDTNGFFNLNGLVFEDSIKFSYQLNEEKKVPKEQVQVFLQPNYSFIPYLGTLPASHFNLSKRLEKDQLPVEITRYVTTKSTSKIINEKITNIEEVKIKGQKKNLTKKLNAQLSGPLFKSGNESVFDFVNDNNGAQSYTNILQWLQGRVAGLSITLEQGSYIPRFRSNPIGIYLDEMPVDASSISSIPVSDIAMVKVIKGYFAGGFAGNTNGAIAIYTRRGGTTGPISDPIQSTQLKQITITGYDKEIPFPNPDYSNDSFKNISQDVRSVLYWNPYIEQQPNEPTTVQFYNNDDAKNYKIIIMGFDRNNDLPIYYNEIMK